MIIQTREIYRCGYCRKVYLIKSACERHESKCRKNPGNYSPCMDCCGHLIKKDFIYSFDTFQGEDEKVVSVLFCTKNNIAVCPFWHTPYEYICDKDGVEVLNITTPHKCDDFIRGEII